MKEKWELKYQHWKDTGILKNPRLMLFMLVWFLTLGSGCASSSAMKLIVYESGDKKSKLHGVDTNVSMLSFTILESSLKSPNKTTCSDRSYPLDEFSFTFFDCCSSELEFFTSIILTGITIFLVSMIRNIVVPKEFIGGKDKYNEIEKGEAYQGGVLWPR